MTVLDLTHPITPDMPVYPGDPQPRLTTLASMPGDGFRQLELTLTTHTGTHVDAPAHLLEHGAALDRYAPGDFAGPGIVLDARQDEAALLQALDTPPAQRAAFVLFRTGHGALWGRTEYLTGWPVISEAVLARLAARHVKGVGVDCLSVDPPACTDMRLHRLLLSADVLIYENLALPDALPGHGFLFVGAPLSLPATDGAPVRALALCDPA